MKSSIIVAGTCLLTLLSPAHAQQAEADPAKFGVIELGAKGIKPLVVTANSTEPPVKLPVRNTNLYDGQALVKSVAEEVMRFSHEMEEEYHVPESHISIVMSSGVPAEITKDDIAAALPDPLKNQISVITVALESTYAFEGIVPLNRRKLNEVILLDIGSGNSKGAYLTSTGPDTFETYAVPIGTGTFAKKVNSARKDGEDFKTAALRVASEEILPSLKSQVKDKPGMQNCSRLYLSGGLPYVMTTLLHPESIGSRATEDASGKNAGDLVSLSAKDIDVFYAMATEHPEQLLKPDLSKIPEAKLGDIQKEVATAGNIFNQDELTGGAILLKTFMDEMHSDRKEAIFFSRSALYAWPLGFISEKIKASEH